MGLLALPQPLSHHEASPSPTSPSLPSLPSSSAKQPVVPMQTVYSADAPSGSVNVRGGSMPSAVPLTGLITRRTSEGQPSLNESWS